MKTYLKENVWPENKAESKGHLSEESRQKAEHSKVTNNRASEMAQWIKAPAAKPEDLSLVLRTHIMEGRE